MQMPVEPAPASAASAAVNPTAEWEVKFNKVKLLAKYCGKCCAVRRGFASHASRSQGCKTHLGTRVLTETELEQLRTDIQEECTSDRLEVKKRNVARDRQLHVDSWAPPNQTSEPSEYRLEFGVHKGLTIEEVCKQHADYFPYLVSFSNSAIESRPSLRDALAKAGLLEDLMRRAPALAMQRATRNLARIQEERGTPIHHEVEQLRLLQAVEANGIIAGDPTPN